MPLELFHDTIAAISTAEGRGALGIIRISGADAIAIVAKMVGDPQSLFVARGGTSVYTTISVVNSDKLIDDVVMHVFRAPRSFTGEDLVEITAHGSAIIAGEILTLLLANGARQAEPGEFSRRAFFNGKIGLEDAELISIKSTAESEKELRGAELANHEKFSRLGSAYNALIGLIAQIDAEIDFGDSDEISINNFDGQLDNVLGILESLLNTSSNRKENAGYFTVALTGPPNVGKSSIFNALLNFERSIVSEIPGTTRDYVEAFINVDGFRVKLVDTAGIREASEVIESKGIELGADAARHADISLLVTDPGDRTPLANSGSKLLHNKVDLDGWDESLHVSALTGQGVENLHRWLSIELESQSADFNRIKLHSSEIARLDSAVVRLKALNIDLEPTLIAEDLRLAASELASLLGMNIGEDSLNHIFAKMCIGK